MPHKAADIAKADLVILDEFGYIPPRHPKAAKLLFRSCR